MKKTFAYIRTLAAVLMTSAAFVACNKEDIATAEQTPQVYTLTIDASMDGGAQTRALEFEGTKLVAKWANDETVDVRSGATLLGTLTVSNVSADGKTCTLSGTLTGTINKYDVLRFHYNYSGTLVNESQTGTLSSTAASDYAMAAVTVKSVDGGNITLESEPRFQTQVAVLKITMQDALANKLNATSLKITIGDKDLCTLSPNATAYSENGDGVVYFALPSAHRVYTEGISSIGLDEEELAAATVTFTATVGGNTYIATKTGYPFAAGKYYATTLTMAKVKPDLLSGVFSVSDSKKVSFSKGNLQATYDGSNWTWAFAANQWDYIGNAAGNTMVTATSPFISENATVDLFGWVGASSNWADNVNQYGITSSSATNNTDGYGNVADETLKSDWGTLIGSGWRTLSMDEWTYLLNTRTVNGGTGENKSYTLNKTVNGKRCLVLYPDNYTGAVYSGSDWASFEAAGCVFLPAAGWRNGTTIDNINDRGYYWSSSSHNTTAAKRLFFAAGLELTGDNSRAFGFSVRLVREVE